MTTGPTRCGSDPFSHVDDASSYAYSKRLREKDEKEIGEAIANVLSYVPEPEDITEADLEKNRPSYHFPEKDEQVGEDRIGKPKIAYTSQTGVPLDRLLEKISQEAVAEASYATVQVPPVAAECVCAAKDGERHFLSCPAYDENVNELVQPVSAAEQLEADARANQVGRQLGSLDWRAEEGLIDRMTRTDLFAFFPQWCEEATDISKQRNRAYATEEQPFANLNRDDTLTGIIQEIANCFKRLQNNANYWAEVAVFERYGIKHPEFPPMSEEQVRDAETDLHNFSNLHRGLRIELSNKRKRAT